ncbi:MAG: dienelactone hydrolase family protein, partial [Phycisphaerae bacterium]|nr:dienelactone hydrolase family protein [Phycisphaerae bacterium]
DATCGEYRIDPDRIYLSGLSMGGIGTWRIGTRHPDRFAALAPVCGEADPKLAANLRRTPVWCFHGDADPVVPVGESRRMIAAMRELGLTPKYSEYAGVPHNSWDRAYGEQGLYTWLLQHRRVRRTRRIQYHFPVRAFETPHTLWWLRLDAVRKRPGYGSVDAAIVGAGVLKMRTRGVKQLSVLLDEGPFGRATSWRVELNGRRCRFAADERCLVLKPTVVSEEDQR